MPSRRLVDPVPVTNIRPGRESRDETARLDAVDAPESSTGKPLPCGELGLFSLSATRLWLTAWLLLLNFAELPNRGEVGWWGTRNRARGCYLLPDFLPPMSYQVLLRYLLPPSRSLGAASYLLARSPHLLKQRARQCTCTREHKPCIRSGNNNNAFIISGDDNAHSLPRVASDSLRPDI